MGCAGIPLIETVAVQDEFVSGVHRIELVGSSCARFYLYSDHTPIDGSKERVLIKQIVIPIDCLPKAVRKTLRFMALQGVEVGKRMFERMLS